MNKAICTVYRTLFRNARQLQAAGQNLEIRPPLDKEAWQSTKHSWVVNDTASRVELVNQALPNIVQVPPSGSFTPEALRACIRANFAACKNASTDIQGQLLDQAFGALRLLSEQMHMQQCSSHSVTDGIQVDVTSAFIGRMQVNAINMRNMFTYRVRITNTGDHRTQLMSRRWVIQDDKGKIVDQVAGPGVVGNTPIIRPYDCFQYYSSAMIESMQGAMHGTFQMLRTHPESQQQFDAQVLPFRLIASK